MSGRKHKYENIRRNILKYETYRISLKYETLRIYENSF